MSVGRLLYLVMLPSVLLVTSLAGQEVEVSGPQVILRDVRFSLNVKSANPTAPQHVVVLTAAGRELAAADVEPLESVEFKNLAVVEASDLPLTIVTAGWSTSFSRPLLPGWVSILPPLIAIVLALAFREVVASLFAGIWLGCFFIAGYNPFTALLMAVDSYARPALADGDHASIIVFSLLLGGMVGILTRMGAARAMVDRVAQLATTPRLGQFAAWFAGLAIFFDDYANTLIVGNTMRPLTDRLKVSREKLAYIVDSTAAPVAAIFFISTWIGYEIGLIGDGLGEAARRVSDPALKAGLANASPVGVFLHSIPYLYYPIAAILMVLLVVLTRRDFGPMLKAEARARAGKGVFREGAELAADMDSLESEPDAKSKWWFALVPVATVVVTVLAGLYTTGLNALAAGEAHTLNNIINNADPFTPLLWGSLLGCLVAIGLAVVSRSLTLTASIDAWVGGLKSMVLAMVILVLAWSLGAVTGSLSTASLRHYARDSAGGAVRGRGSSQATKVPGRTTR